MKKTKTFLKKDNACFNSPCLNGATCTSTNGNFVCTCAQFYSGTNCQIRNITTYLSKVKEIFATDVQTCLK